MSKGRMLTELRQSHAAGVHDSVPTRSQVNRQAISDELEDDMAFIYPEDDFYDDDIFDGLDPYHDDPEGLASIEYGGLDDYPLIGGDSDLYSEI